MNYNGVKIVMLIGLTLGTSPTLSAITGEELFKDSANFKQNTENKIIEAQTKAENIKKDITKSEEEKNKEAKSLEDYANTLKTSLNQYTEAETTYQNATDITEKNDAVTNAEKAVEDIKKLQEEIMTEEKTISFTEKSTTTDETQNTSEDLTFTEKLFNVVLKPFQALIDRISNIFNVLFSADPDFAQAAAKAKKDQAILSKRIDTVNAHFIIPPGDHDTLVEDLTQQLEEQKKQEAAFNALAQGKPLPKETISTKITLPLTTVSKEANDVAQRRTKQTPADIHARNIFKTLHKAKYAYDVFPGVDEQTDFTNKEILDAIQETYNSEVLRLNTLIRITQRENESLAPGPDKTSTGKSISEWTQQIKDYKRAYDILTNAQKRSDEKLTLDTIKNEAQILVNKKQVIVDPIYKETQVVVDNAAQQVNEVITAEQRATEINAAFEKMYFDTETKKPIRNPYEVLGLSNFSPDILTAYYNKIPQKSRSNIIDLREETTNNINQATTLAEKERIHADFNKKLSDMVNPEFPEIQQAYDMLTNNDGPNVQLTLNGKVVYSSKSRVDTILKDITAKVNA